MPSPIYMRQIGGNPYPNIALKLVNTSLQYASVASNASLQTGDIDFTLAAWVWTDVKVAFGGVMSKGNTQAVTVGEYSIYYHTGTDRWRFEVRSPADVLGAVAADNAGAAPLQQWQLLIAWHDSVNNQIGISVDAGTPDLAAWSTGVKASTSAFDVGRLATAYHNGRLDSFGFWKRMLTTGEQLQIYNRNIGMSYKDLGGPLRESLISWWNFDGNYTDSHSTNHLTPNNLPTFISGKR
jgi:hypothetical protein